MSNRGDMCIGSQQTEPRSTDVFSINNTIAKEVRWKEMWNIIEKKKTTISHLATLQIPSWMKMQENLVGQKANKLWWCHGGWAEPEVRVSGQKVNTAALERDKLEAML